MRPAEFRWTLFASIIVVQRHREFPRSGGTSLTRTLMIDTTLRSDAVIALIMELRASDVRVSTITAIAGNVPVEQATQNVLYTVELCKAETPVFAGAGKPLVRELVTAQWFHGKDGLGDHGYTPSSRRVDSGHAVDAI